MVSNGSDEEEKKEEQLPAQAQAVANLVISQHSSEGMRGGWDTQHIHNSSQLEAPDKEGHHEEDEEEKIQQFNNNANMLDEPVIVERGGA